ncbi:MAG: hypothetical protein OEY39_03285 [Candidatus Bathyarchaeota archaeon]|nr:hypothetical protein [Candidatus Bathyarchaeota archaeon]MDH5623472.1 hypothetical protein [Candidatus Bathyarchaeota archaeon]MDH5635864.1 hypothetical protein [Candidatus Bathyarchaeota archaeon]
MSEGKPSIEELSRRIDQLLNVLTMISRDLADISKSLKSAGAPTAAPAIPAVPKEGMRGVEDVRESFSSDLEEMLIFEETGDYIVIKTRRFLGSDNFAKIASIVRSLGGEYISAGKDSHFKVPRESG